MAKALAQGAVSAYEVVCAHLNQIEKVNPKVNAICTLVADRAIEEAKNADSIRANGEKLGALHGLPITIKDLTPTKGILTTQGSSIYKDTVPEQDALIVQRLKKASAIIVGKSNTPEFGAGSHTFNTIFGSTHNPYDLSKTCGGSSGGAAVSVTCGMAPLAEGSDFGGSLRNPAAWCNAVGFRTTIGRVPKWPVQLGWSNLSVNGPIARNVRDVALMLSVIAGYHPYFPLSLQGEGEEFKHIHPIETRKKAVKISWCNTIGNRPVEPAVTQVLNKARHTIENIGCKVYEEEPDLADADQVFDIVRAYVFAHTHQNHLKHYKGKLKDTIIWNSERGISLSALDVSKAEEQHTNIVVRMADFWDKYDYLCMPVTATPPFPIEWEYPTEINGIKMDNYIRWMWPCYVITVTGSPAISVPAGFTSEGLPIGLQIVGKPNDDLGVLRLALAFEEATQFYKIKPQGIF